MLHSSKSCILCDSDGGEIIYKNDLFRVILVDDDIYIGYLRVIVNDHVVEMSDLSTDDALIIFNVVLKLELLVRKFINPYKINLASLGNVVPHLHWHIIPRFLNDKHFPNPIWGDITNTDYIPPLYDRSQLIKEVITNLE